MSDKRWCDSCKGYHPTIPAPPPDPRDARIAELEAENARRQESIDELSSDFTKMHKRYKDDRAKLAASEKLVGELATALRDLRMAFEENDWRHIQESLNRTAAVLSKVTP